MTDSIEFRLSPEQEYIELNKLLKVTGVVGTGGEANVRILDGDVQVNSVIASEKRKKIRSGDQVLIDNTTILVVG